MSGPGTNPYESGEMLDRYLLFHYGTPEEILPWAQGPGDSLDFPAQCVRECFEPERLGPGSRALDLGCAVGRSTFELARFCGEAVGLDASASFIRAAAALAAGEALPYARLEEGARATSLAARAPAGIDPRRIRFVVGDAEAPDAGLGRFDAVLLANLIDRLADPGRCLGRLAGLVAPGGQLAIASPYTWLEGFTPRERWLCGADGSSLHGLRRALEGAFALVRTLDLPFLIREHARKYQWGISQASVWRRI